MTTISSKPITVQNWPDADLVDAPQCYTRSDLNSLGASTSLFPVGTDSVLVDCDGDGNRTLRVLRILPFLALAVALAAGLGAAVYCYMKRKQRAAAAAAAKPPAV